MQQATQTFHANGKLLLTGEYFVLDGAIALAVPTNRGQHLHIETTTSKEFHWQSYDIAGKAWFEGVFQAGNYQNSTDDATGKTLERIFQTIEQERAGFIAQLDGLKASTQLEFPRDWGLGSSSTLIHLLAQWAKVDPFALQFAIFGGSGYDIACAGVAQPIRYQKMDGRGHFEATSFQPTFRDQLYFLHLGKKQNSRQGIAHYRQLGIQKTAAIDEMTQLTAAFLAANTLIEFEELIELHEAFIAEQLRLKRVQARYFADYWGKVKSLGAWGGDFVLITSDRSTAATQTYFKQKGFETFFSYDEFILNDSPS